MERVGLGDQLADWLVRHCPLTTLTLLSLIVIASAVTLDKPWILIAAAALGDVALRYSRRARRPRADASPIRSGATA